MFWMYWLLALACVLLTLWELLDHDRNWREQWTAAIVLIPFLLRVFLIK